MAENSDQLVHFHEYFKIIRNRLWVILIIFALTVASGLYVTTEVLPKIYTATSQIQIRPSGVYDEVGVGGGSRDKPFDPVNFQAEFQIMQSPDVLGPIITELQLDQVWAKRLKYTSGAMPMQDALKYMSNVIKFDFARGTNIVKISASSEVPKECSDIANALADQYKTMRDVEENQRTNRAMDALRDQIAQQQEVVDKRKAEVEKMRLDLGAKGISIPNDIGTGTVSSRTESDLDESKKDLLAAKEEYDSRQVLLNSVIKLPDDQFLSTLAGLGQEEAAIADLDTERLKLESDIQNLLKDGFGDDNPRILSLQAELAAKKDQITEAIAGLRRAMIINTDMAHSRVDVLTKEVDTLNAKVLSDTTSSLVPFHDAEREQDQQQSILDVLNVRLKQIITDSQLYESPVRIIARAEPPEIPTTPNKGFNLMVSIFCGLFVGVGVAFLIEYLDTSVKTMADAESLLGLPVLTVIPNKGGPMPLVQDSGRLPHAEGYRILRAKLDLKVQNGIGPSLTMLSGGPGEGKSTTIYNLAVICAQAGQSVILIDCDLRRPTLHELMGVSNERGLSNYLRGEGEAISFIQRTAIPKLHVLTAGNMAMSEIGVLAGDKIRIMLDDLKQRYDLVLIDAPPVLGISDGSIIAREVDYVILVIQHRRYPREISLRAKRAIEEVHGNCVGMVLNCVAVKSDDSYYYYSNYGNYYRKKPKKRKDIAGANGNGNGNGAPVSATARKTSLDSDEF
jgi:succinoglycan biosynthesis transport protein ExoP